MNNYLVFSGCVKGITHESKDIVNQDIGLAKVNPNHAYLIVSDGHGGDTYVRSHIGAKHAAIVLEALFNEFASIYKDYNSINLIEQSLKADIIKSWRKLTLDHYLKNPIFNNESDPYKFYGTTLLGVLLKEDYMVITQIGDGNILTLLENNEIIQYIEKDKELIGNETTSLCAVDAIKDLHVKIVKLDVKPVLIMATTDGIINSFTNINDFYSMPNEIVNEIKDFGFKATCSNLKQLLMDMATKGSGDDCTISLLYDSSKQIINREKMKYGIKKIRS